MANFTDLYDWVLPELPGCDIPIINFHIRKIVRQFLKRTTFWREDVTIVMVPGQQSYAVTPIVPGNGTTMVGVPLGILTATMNNQPIWPIAEQTRPFDGVLIQPTKPNAWFQLAPNAVSFYPVPDNAATYTAILQVYKTIPDTHVDSTFPDELRDHWIEIVANGVKSSLMGMPKKPWSNLDMALTYNKMYTDGVLSLRGRFRSGGQRNATRVTFPRFGH